MTEVEIQSLKDLDHNEFIQKILTQLVFVAKDQDILDELMEHSKFIEIYDELVQTLKYIRDEKIVSILENEK